MDTSKYDREYQAYMAYALERFLIDKQEYTEYDAKIRVMQDYDEVHQEAQAAGFL